MRVIGRVISGPFTIGRVIRSPDILPVDGVWGACVLNPQERRQRKNSNCKTNAKCVQGTFSSFVVSLNFVKRRR
jgi:hypothetical protein